MALRTSADDYYGEDIAYAKAWDILTENCDFPPSLEVFNYGLELTRLRSRAPISVQQYARTLSDSYQRIPNI